MSDEINKDNTNAIRAGKEEIWRNPRAHQGILSCEKKSITITWHIDDVKELEPDLTNEEAYEILRRAKRGHDATIGINWDVLQELVDEFIQERFA